MRRTLIDKVSNGIVRSLTSSFIELVSELEICEDLKI